MQVGACENAVIPYSVTSRLILEHIPSESVTVAVYSPGLRLSISSVVSDINFYFINR